MLVYDTFPLEGPLNPGSIKHFTELLLALSTGLPLTYQLIHPRNFIIIQHNNFLAAKLKTVLPLGKMGW